ncbi:Kazal-type serine proteinase inhibitor 2 [Penaeus vannamei]|uniref:Kazal-type serine proteinase inhibitor 2 n=1 Tax=Penaeus vannamei TaxID=6689 RepID=A0A423SHI2_PENVA|nr:Kazal-type serine proteinase inhibitor 2 [Penaeus vannamei]
MFKTCWFLPLLLLASGQESCDFLCPYHIDPVCGSDGVTYPNLCVLELADCLSDEDITLAHPGACEANGEACDTVCSTNYDPVCGSDGATYPNLCELERASCLSEEDITAAYEGECKDCGFPCQDIYDPVCGSDGATYPNLCELERANCLSEEDIAMAYPGECKVTPGNCNLGCPGNYDPVCGSDGVTYPNLCALEVADCLSDEDITLCECKDAAKDDCGFPCPDNYDPVCGSDGATYPNLCELERASCLSEEDITAAYEGECKDCGFPCQDIYDPVCGSDGATYPNLCELERANCLSEEDIAMASGNSLAHPGECSSCDLGCSGLWDPVCGTDGVTYSNLCQLEIASCLGGDVSLAHEGPC